MRNTPIFFLGLFVTLASCGQLRYRNNRDLCVAIEDPFLNLSPVTVEECVLNEASQQWFDDTDDLNQISSVKYKNRCLQIESNSTSTRREGSMVMAGRCKTTKSSGETSRTIPSTQQTFGFVQDTMLQWKGLGKYQMANATSYCIELMDGDETPGNGLWLQKCNSRRQSQRWIFTLGREDYD